MNKNIKEDLIEYSERLRKNTHDIELRFIKNKEYQKDTESHFNIILSENKENLSDLFSQLSIMEKDISSLAKEVLIILSEFKKIVLKEELKRVEEKCDLLNIENLITKKEFISLLKEI